MTGKLKHVVWPPHGEYLLDTLTGTILSAKLKALVTQNPVRYKAIGPSHGASADTPVNPILVMEFDDGSQVDVR